MKIKKIILLLVAASVSLRGMDIIQKQEKLTKKQDINWQEREKEYLNWGFYKPLNTKEYWIPLKEGLENGGIKFNPIAHESSEMKLKEGFLAYEGPVDVEGGKAILLYPSPMWMYASLVLSDKTTKVYAASSKGDTSFKSLAFKEKAKNSLPKGLEINEQYLPGWKTNSNIVLWYNKWDAKEGDNIASQFEKISLESNSDNFECPNFACGIQSLPRHDEFDNTENDENDENDPCQQKAMFLSILCNTNK